MNPEQQRLFKIYNDLFAEDIQATDEAVREAKKAFSYIKQDALYWMDNFLEAEDE